MPFDPARLRRPLRRHFDDVYGAPEYTSWIDESLSWKESCYLGDWSFVQDRRYKGPDALRLFADISVNTMENFEIGQSKHVIHCNPDGKIIHEGVLSRLAQDELAAFSTGVRWADFILRTGNYDVAAEPLGWTKYHLQGPNSVFVLENAAGQNVRDLHFMRSTTIQIAGHDVIVLRQGMTGEIGFELQAPIDQGPEIYGALLEAGRESGIRQMGGRVSQLNHLEAAYPTVMFDYLPAIFGEWSAEYRDEIDAESRYALAGSFESDDIADWYRSPVQFGWGNRVKFDHDFIGRDALKEELEDPRRTIVTLVWNSDDVIDIYRALFRLGEPLPEFMEMPRDGRAYMWADRVLRGDMAVGVSTSRGYSAYFREMLSLCVIDVEDSMPGTEVSVVWGSPGTPQREIRATVAQAPYKEDRSRVDLETLVR
jgi:vanillate/3-O-methylgallate O-demethylase